MTAKYTSSGSAIRATSHGREVIASPCKAKRITIVNSSPYSAAGPIFGGNRTIPPAPDAMGPNALFTGRRALIRRRAHWDATAATRGPRITDRRCSTCGFTQ
ncbi:hypothetical protein Acsp04_60000 [Actinomadura sp. NBRC 104425]|nr:hypothetical protein Acsp04_60000 [Actinomadura sp. NBRC 104425]